jgi:hypothetical protein
MKTLSELKKEIDRMLSISYSAELYFNDNMYLLNPDTKEEQVVAQNDLFIRRARYALGVMSILQINKLFGGKNDHFSLRKLLNTLLNNHRSSEWKEKIAVDLIKEWQAKLEELPMVECIKKINGLRNNYYAHSDRQPEALERLIVHTEEMKMLLKFCNEVLLKISVDVFNQYKYSVISDTQKASGILKRLSVHVVKKTETTDQFS